MKFGYTIIYVPNLQETLEFYEKAFGLKRKFIAESGMYGELDTGNTTLSFCMEEHIQRENLSFQTTRPSALPPAIEIAFLTDNVENSYKKAIEAGAHPLKEPSTTTWGQKVAYVRDINGVLIELCTPIN